MHYPGADFVWLEVGVVSAVVAEDFTWTRDSWLVHLCAAELLVTGEAGMMATKSSQLTYTTQYHRYERPCSEKEHVTNVSYSSGCKDRHECQACLLGRRILEVLDVEGAIGVLIKDNIHIGPEKLKGKIKERRVKEFGMAMTKSKSR